MLRRVLRSPVVLAVICGMLVRVAFAAAGRHPALPSAVEGALDSLRDAFAASALVTLGLSIKTQMHALSGVSVTACCLVLSKLILLPLLMRLLVAAALPDSAGGASWETSSRDFTFIYGMLPSAPTVVVFAREYGDGDVAALLAALQLICLLASVPCLLCTAFAIQTAAGHPEPRTLVAFSQSVAALGGVCALSATVLLTLAARRGVSSRVVGLLVGVAAASLLLSALDFVVELAAGCDVSASPNAAAAAGAACRALSSISGWAVHSMRALLAVLGCLMAHHACPERSRRAASAEGSLRLRRKLLLAVAAALALPAIPEAIEWFGGGGGPSTMLRVSQLGVDVVAALLIGLSLALVWLAPAPQSGVCSWEAGGVAVRSGRAGDESRGDGRGVGVGRVPPEPQPQPHPAAAGPPQPSPPHCVGAGPTASRWENIDRAPLLAAAAGSGAAREAPPTEGAGSDAPPQPSAARLLRRWRGRLCLLELYAAVSMLTSLTTTLYTLLRPADADAVQAELLFVDSALLHCHGIAVLCLFALSPEVLTATGGDRLLGSWARRCRLCVARCMPAASTSGALPTDSNAPARPLPRNSSGFWGVM